MIVIRGLLRGRGARAPPQCLHVCTLHACVWASDGCRLRSRARLSCSFTTMRLEIWVICHLRRRRKEVMDSIIWGQSVCLSERLIKNFGLGWNLLGAWLPPLATTDPSFLQDWRRGLWSFGASGYCWYLPLLFVLTHGVSVVNNKQRYTYYVA